MRQVFIHIHLWKTGGTTFNKICRSNFGSAYHRDHMLIQHWFLNSDQVEWIIRYQPWLGCYSCHMLSGNLPYEMDEVEVRALSFVRDPVRRFISSANYNSQEEDKRGTQLFARELDEYYEQTLGKNESPYADGQSIQLAGTPEQLRTWRIESAEDLLARFQRRVEQGYLLPLLTERFDDSCILLERLFPQQFQDCSYLARNVTRKRCEPVDESLLERISQHMQTDLKLHRFCLHNLDRMLEEHFDPTGLESARRDFQRRCRRRARLSELRRLALKPIHLTGALIERGHAGLVQRANR